MRRAIEVFVDGELGAEEAERVRRHLAECWCCSEMADVGRAIRAALRQVERPRSVVDLRLRRFAAGLDGRSNQRG